MRGEEKDNIPGTGADGFGGAGGSNEDNIRRGRKYTRRRRTYSFQPRKEGWEWRWRWRQRWMWKRWWMRKRWRWR